MFSIKIVSELVVFTAELNYFIYSINVYILTGLG